MRSKIFSVLKGIICLFVVIAFLVTPTMPFLSAMDHALSQEESSVIDQYIQEQMADCRIPGFSLGVVKGDKVLYSKGYGKADDTNRPVTPQTPFVVGSVSKTFTALAMMQLVEAGKMNLDSPVHDYLSEFETADAGLSRQITVCQLLNHTSGIATEAEFQVATLKGDDETISELVSKFNRITLAHKPGSKFEYSNANYILLGELIQKVAGLSYEEYIQKNIFDPLEMRHSYTSSAAARQDDLAKGYLSVFGFPIAADFPYRKDFLPAYSIISCAEDMTHYMIAMMNDGEYMGRRILSAQGIADMQQSSAKISEWSSYGLGWYVTSGSIYHGGEIPDYQAKIKLLPEDGLGVVLMYNTSSTSAVTLFNVGYRDRIESGIINALYGLPPTDGFRQNPFDLNSYPMALTYGILLGIVLLVLLLFIMSILRLRSMQKRLAKSRFSFIRTVFFAGLINVLLPLWLLLAVPIEKQVSWAVIVHNMPDIGWSLLVSSLLLLCIGAVKGSIILKYLRNKKTIQV